MFERLRIRMAIGASPTLVLPAVCALTGNPEEEEAGSRGPAPGREHTYEAALIGWLMEIVGAIGLVHNKEAKLYVLFLGSICCICCSVGFVFGASRSDLFPRWNR